jgi:hypothetical protein
MAKKKKANAPQVAKKRAGSPKAGPPAGRRPALVLTINGRAAAKIIGPKAANDLRIIWGVGVLGGGGYWTRNGREIPKTRFIFLPGINDFHFSPTGRFTPGPPVTPPSGANDVELIWRGGGDRGGMVD